MPAITIRNIPQQTRDELAARAAAKGQSLQEYLSALLRSVAERPDVDQTLALIRARKDATGSVVSAAEILAHRDADRR
jgi:plasmid stability protein